MTKSEQKRDRQDTLGNPLIKRRQKDEQHANMVIRLATGVKNATFGVAGPTLCVAFRYAPPEVLVPTLVARAVDLQAGVLREALEAASIPMVYDPDIVTEIAQGVSVGSPIRKESFQTIIKIMSNLSLLRS